MPMTKMKELKDENRRLKSCVWLRKCKGLSLEGLSQKSSAAIYAAPDWPIGSNAE